jgi:FixJ family two-component response regulator
LVAQNRRQIETAHKKSVRWEAENERETPHFIWPHAQKKQVPCMDGHIRDIEERQRVVATRSADRYAATMTDVGLIHIIDDDAGVRKALSSLIRSVGNDVRIYESTSEFLEAKLPEVPSCLLLDVRMPGSNGLDFQASLATRGIFLPVILMTGYGDIQMSVQGMKAGAVDFLTKPLRHQDVLDAIGAALSRDREQRKESAEIAAVRTQYAQLTPREVQVFALVTSGKMNKQMAGELKLSEITVKLHRGSMMKKMGVRTVADLVKQAEVLRRAAKPEER